jgi:RimJ/RimL family protein N-acetyltransferase
MKDLPPPHTSQARRGPLKEGRRHVLTARLQLDAVVMGDLDEHFALLSDPGVWRHLPARRHTDPARTAEDLRKAAGHWARTGLGYWTARLRTDLPADQLPPGLEPGATVGTGGCAVREGTDWWNLYYRLTPPAWGRGLAAELVAAALDAAHTVDPDRPVIAYLLEHNAESRGRAERSGLTLVWRGPDAGNPDPDAVRLVYADRPVDDDLLARVVALP